MKEETEVGHEQYLTFVVDDEEYGIGILRVREIIAHDTLTRVPRAAPYIRGMINLRGSVVPVIDLAMKFGLRPAPITRSTCIVIVELGKPGDAVIAGLMVDSVSQVVELSGADIQPAPQFGTLCADLLVGMAPGAGHKFALIVDIDRVLSTEECLSASIGAEPGDEEGPAEAAI